MQSNDDSETYYTVSNNLIKRADRERRDLIIYSFYIYTRAHSFLYARFLLPSHDFFYLKKAV